MKNRLLMLLACLVIATLSGCAFTDEKIDISYHQPMNVLAVKGANKVSVNVNVNDRRADTSKVSSKKNGYGMETAAIFATDPVEATVKQAIESELSLRGFKLGNSNALVNITADLTRFYNDHKMGFLSGDAVADFELSVSVKSQDGESLFDRHIVAQGKEANTQLATGNNAKLALEQALENGMRSLFDDRKFISALLSASANDTESESETELEPKRKTKPKSKVRKH